MGFQEFRRSPSLAVAVVFIALMANSMLLTIIIPFVPPLLKKEGKSSIEIGLLFSSKPMVQILANPFVGKFADRVGPRVPLFGGLLMLSASTLLFAFSAHYWEKVLARCLQGVCSALINTGGMSLLALVFKDEKARGKAMSIAIIGTGLGALSGPPIGSLFYAAFGQIATFSIIAVFCLCDAALQLLLSSETRAPVPEPVLLSSSHRINSSESQQPQSQLSSSHRINSRESQQRQSMSAVGYSAVGMAQPLMGSPRPSLYEVQRVSTASRLLSASSKLTHWSINTECSNVISSVSIRGSVCVLADPEPTPVSFWQIIFDPYIAVVVLSMFLSSASLGALDPLLPIWLERHPLRVPEKYIGLVFLPTTIMYVIFSVYSGFVKPPRRWISILVGLLFIGGSLAVIALPHDIYLELVLLGSLGVGLGLVDSTSMPVLATIGDRRHTGSYGRIYSIADGGSALGFVVGPLASAALKKAINLEWSFHIIGIFTAVLALSPLALRKMLRPLPEGEEGEGAREGEWVVVKEEVPATA